MTAPTSPLFRSVFNHAAVPMLLIGSRHKDLILIAHNDRHKLFCNFSEAGVEGVAIGKALEVFYGIGKKGVTTLTETMMQAKRDGQSVEIPFFDFETETAAGAERMLLESPCRLEVVPVLNADQEVDYLLAIWHKLEGVMLDDIQRKAVPMVKKEITEVLSDNKEQLIEGHKDLVDTEEMLETISTELVETQESLNMLKDRLDQKVEAAERHLPGQLTEIEKQRNRLKQFLMQAPAGICILDGPEFVFELVNPSFRELFADRKLLGLTLIEAFPEIKGQRIWEILQEVYQNGQDIQENELMIPFYNRKEERTEERYFNFIYQARFDAKGSVDGIILFVFEVTDMIAVRLEVAENEEKFRLLLNSIPQIAWTNTVDGVINFRNERWYTYTGLSPEQDAEFKDIVHPDDFQYHSVQFKEILEHSNTGHYEIRLKGNDGGYRWYLIRMESIKDETDTTVLLWIGTATDIHELKELQQQKDDLINIVSHELKTPISSLKVSMQLLSRMKQDSSEKMQELIDLANRGVDKVSGMINDLLDSSQLSEGGLPIKINPFNIYHLITNCIEHVFQKEIHKFIIDGNLKLIVYADAERIEQVMINLISNALKYAPQSEEIRINIAETDNHAIISVIDQGAGVPSEKIPLLFNRYYRMEHSRQPGLGLGLFISAQIIAKHHGKIGATSKLGAGTTFWFTLPVTASN